MAELQWVRLRRIVQRRGQKECVGRHPRCQIGEADRALGGSRHCRHRVATCKPNCKRRHPKDRHEHRCMKPREHAEGVHGGRYYADMKAVGLYKYLPIDHPESLLDVEVETPSPAGRDLLVEVKAISVNPVDTKRRAPKD